MTSLHPGNIEPASKPESIPPKDAEPTPKWLGVQARICPSSEAAAWFGLHDVDAFFLKDT
jgi:hypothetical protein